MIFSSSFFLLMILKNKNNLLSCLLMFEGLSLSVMYFMISGVGGGINSYSGLIMFMYVAVVEGCLGLGLLVNIVRGVGGDMFFYQNYF